MGVAGLAAEMLEEIHGVVADAVERAEDQGGPADETSQSNISILPAAFAMQQCGAGARGNSAQARDTAGYVAAARDTQPGPLPTQPRKVGRQKPKALTARQSRSRSAYHSIAATRSGWRSSVPPGKVWWRMAAKTSKRSAVPATASAMSLPARPVVATPCPE